MHLRIYDWNTEDEPAEGADVENKKNKKVLVVLLLFGCIFEGDNIHLEPFYAINVGS